MKVFGIAGWSGSGKTTLLLRLIPALVRHGIVVGTIKHTHHDPFVGDAEDRALLMAGAQEALTVSPHGFALAHDCHGGAAADFGRLTALPRGVDLLLVEGFKHGPHPKLELWDAALGKPLLAKEHPSVVAIATDSMVEGLGCPVFRRGDVDSICRFILSYCEQTPAV